MRRDTPGAAPFAAPPSPPPAIDPEVSLAVVAARAVDETAWHLAVVRESRGAPAALARAAAENAEAASRLTAALDALSAPQRASFHEVWPLEKARLAASRAADRKR